MKNCNICGGEARLKVSFGGFNTYYSVHCGCGRSSRGKGIMAGLVPLGGDYAASSDAPQDSEDEAMKRWDEINS